MAANLPMMISLQLDPGSAQRVAKQIESSLGNIQVRTLDAKNFAKTNAAIGETSKRLGEGQKKAETFWNTLEGRTRSAVAYTVISSAILKLTGAVSQATRESIRYEAELLKISQVTGDSVKRTKDLQAALFDVSKQYNVNISKVAQLTRTLTQTGLSFREAAKGAEILSRTSLLATFDSLTSTTEGLIAVMQTFNLTVNQGGKVLEQINIVSKKFAVESGDIVEAIRRTGGAFSAAGGQVNELIALFTSVRSTSRESAETIATGFRTIFGRLQRPKTIQYFKELGAQLETAEGQFIGPLEAIKEISRALEFRGIRAGSTKFAEVVEQIGGIRQISRVVPLLEQFQKTERALALQNDASAESFGDLEKAQKGLGFQLGQLKQEFTELIAQVVNSSSFKVLAQTFIGITRTVLSLTKSLQPLLPLITAFATVKIGRGITKLATGGINFKSVKESLGFATGGMVPGSGNSDTVPAMLTPGEFVIRKSAVKAFGADRLAKINKYATGGIVELTKRKPSIAKYYDNDITGIEDRYNVTPTNQALPKSRDQYRKEAKFIWKQAIKEGSKAASNDYIAQKTGGFVGRGSQKLGDKELDPNYLPQDGRKYNKIAGGLAELDVKKMLKNAKKLADIEGPDFEQQNGDFVEVKTTKRKVPEKEIIAKAVLAEGIDKNGSYKDSIVQTVRPKITYIRAMNRGGFVQKFEDGGVAEDDSQILFAAPRQPKRPFGTEGSSFPKRISNAYFKAFDIKARNEDLGVKLDTPLRNTSVRVDESEIREAYDSTPLDLEKFKASFKAQLSRNSLIKGMSDFAKFVGLPSESIMDYLPQVVDFNQNTSTLAAAYFDRRPSLNQSAYNLENFGWSKAHDQDMYGIEALIQEKQKEVRRITKKPVRTFEDGSFLYDTEAFGKANDELYSLKNKLADLQETHYKAVQAARENAKDISQKTGRGTIGFNPFKLGSPGSDLYHELGHQLLNSFRTRVPESFDKYSAKVISLFEGDNDDVAMAIDALPQPNYNSADIAYGRSYKIKSLLSKQQALSMERKPENKDLIAKASEVRSNADAIKDAKSFKDINPIVNSTLGMLGVKESYISKLEDIGKEEFLTTLLQNYPILDSTLNNILQSTLDELFASSGMQRQRFANGGIIQKFAKGGEAASEKQAAFVNSLLEQFQRDVGQRHPATDEWIPLDSKAAASSIITKLKAAQKETSLLKEFLGRGVAYGYAGGRSGSGFVVRKNGPGRPQQRPLSEFGGDKKKIQEYIERGELVFGSNAPSSRAPAATSATSRLRTRYGYGGRRRYAAGGSVGTDTVPALLTPGEFVINKKSAQAFGYDKLHEINKYAAGGFVGMGGTMGAQAQKTIMAQNPFASMSGAMGEAARKTVMATNNMTEAMTKTAKVIEQEGEKTQEGLKKASSGFKTSSLEMIFYAEAAANSLEQFAGININRDALEAGKVKAGQFDIMASFFEKLNADNVDKFSRKVKSAGQTVGKMGDKIGGRFGKMLGKAGMGLEKFGGQLFANAGKLGKIGKLGSVIGRIMAAFELAGGFIESIFSKDYGKIRDRAVAAGDVEGAGEAALKAYNQEFLRGIPFIGGFLSALQETIPFLQFEADARGELVVATAQAQASLVKIDREFGRIQTDMKAAFANSDFDKVKTLLSEQAAGISELQTRATDLIDRGQRQGSGSTFSRVMSGAVAGGTIGAGIGGTAGSFAAGVGAIPGAVIGGTIGTIVGGAKAYMDAIGKTNEEIIAAYQTAGDLFERAGQEQVARIDALSNNLNGAITNVILAGGSLDQAFDVFKDKFGEEAFNDLFGGMDVSSVEGLAAAADAADAKAKESRASIDEMTEALSQMNGELDNAGWWAWLWGADKALEREIALTESRKKQAEATEKIAKATQLAAARAQQAAKDAETLARAREIENAALKESLLLMKERIALFDKLNQGSRSMALALEEVYAAMNGGLSRQQILDRENIGVSANTLDMSGEEVMRDEQAFNQMYNAVARLGNQRVTAGLAQGRQNVLTLDQIQGQMLNLDPTKGLGKIITEARARAESTDPTASKVEAGATITDAIIKELNLGDQLENNPKLKAALTEYGEALASGAEAGTALEEIRKEMSEEQAKLIEEVQSKYNEYLKMEQQLQQYKIEQINRHHTLQQKVYDAEMDYLSKRLALNEKVDDVLDEGPIGKGRAGFLKQRGEQRRANRLAGIGAARQRSGLPANTRAAEQSTINSLNNLNPELDNFGETMADLTGQGERLLSTLQDEIAAEQDYLDSLIATAKAQQEYEQTLNDAQGSLVRDLVTGTQEEQASTLSTLNAAAYSAMQGSFQGIPDDMKKDVFSVFDQFGDVEIPGLGMTGRDAQRNIAKNELMQNWGVDEGTAEQLASKMVRDRVPIDERMKEMIELQEKKILELLAIENQLKQALLMAEKANNDRFAMAVDNFAQAVADFKNNTLNASQGDPEGDQSERDATRPPEVPMAGVDQSNAESQKRGEQPTETQMAGTSTGGGNRECIEKAVANQTQALASQNQNAESSDGGILSNVADELAGLSNAAKAGITAGGGLIGKFGPKIFKSVKDGLPGLMSTVTKTFSKVVDNFKTGFKYSQIAKQPPGMASATDDLVRFGINQTRSGRAGAAAGNVVDDFMTGFRNPQSLGKPVGSDLVDDALDLTRFKVNNSFMSRAGARAGGFKNTIMGGLNTARNFVGGLPGAGMVGNLVNTGKDAAGFVGRQLSNAGGLLSKLPGAGMVSNLISRLPSISGMASGAAKGIGKAVPFLGPALGGAFGYLAPTEQSADPDNPYADALSNRNSYANAAFGFLGAGATTMGDVGAQSTAGRFLGLEQGSYADMVTGNLSQFATGTMQNLAMGNIAAPITTGAAMIGQETLALYNDRSNEATSIAKTGQMGQSFVDANAVDNAALAGMTPEEVIKVKEAARLRGELAKYQEKVDAGQGDAKSKKQYVSKYDENGLPVEYSDTSVDATLTNEEVLNKLKTQLNNAEAEIAKLKSGKEAADTEQKISEDGGRDTESYKQNYQTAMDNNATEEQKQAQEEKVANQKQAFEDAGHEFKTGEDGKAMQDAEDVKQGAATTDDSTQPKESDSGATATGGGGGGLSGECCDKIVSALNRVIDAIKSSGGAGGGDGGGAGGGAAGTGSGSGGGAGGSATKIRDLTQEEIDRLSPNDTPNEIAKKQQEQMPGFFEKTGRQVGGFIGAEETGGMIGAQVDKAIGNIMPGGIPGMDLGSMAGKLMGGFGFDPQTAIQLAEKAMGSITGLSGSQDILKSGAGILGGMLPGNIGDVLKGGVDAISGQIKTSTDTGGMNPLDWMKDAAKNAGIDMVSGQIKGTIDDPTKLPELMQTAAQVAQNPMAQDVIKGQLESVMQDPAGMLQQAGSILNRGEFSRDMIKRMNIPTGNFTDEEKQANADRIARISRSRAGKSTSVIGGDLLEEAKGVGNKLLDVGKTSMSAILGGFGGGSPKETAEVAADTGKKNGLVFPGGIGSLSVDKPMPNAIGSQDIRDAVISNDPFKAPPGGDVSSNRKVSGVIQPKVDTKEYIGRMDQMKIGQDLPSTASADPLGKIFADKYDPFNSQTSPDYSPVQKSTPPSTASKPVAGVAKPKGQVATYEEVSAAFKERAAQMAKGPQRLDDANLSTSTIDDASARRLLEEGSSGGRFKDQTEMNHFDSLLNTVKSGALGPNIEQEGQRMISTAPEYQKRMKEFMAKNAPSAGQSKARFDNIRGTILGLDAAKSPLNDFQKGISSIISQRTGMPLSDIRGNIEAGIAEGNALGDKLAFGQPTGPNETIKKSSAMAEQTGGMFGGMGGVAKTAGGLLGGVMGGPLGSIAGSAIGGIAGGVAENGIPSMSDMANQAAGYFGFGNKEDKQNAQPKKDIAPNIPARVAAQSRTSNLLGAGQNNGYGGGNKAPGGGGGPIQVNTTGTQEIIVRLPDIQALVNQSITSLIYNTVGDTFKNIANKVMSANNFEDVANSFNEGVTDVSTKQVNTQKTIGGK